MGLNPTDKKEDQLLSKSDSLIPFLAGLGVGAAAAVLLASETGRSMRHRVNNIARRTADAMQTQAINLGGAAEDVIEQGMSTWARHENKRSEMMSDLMDKASEQADDAAKAVKNTAEIIIDKSKRAAHSAGQKLEEGGKRLQDA